MERIAHQKRAVQEFEKLTKDQEKQGSFKKGCEALKITMIKKVAPSPLSPEVLMCKVHWEDLTKKIEIKMPDGTKVIEQVGEPIEFMPSYVPITIVKQKCPEILLDFYEQYYF